MIHAALGEYATPLLERFLTLLAEKKWFSLLSSVVEEFQAHVDRSQNVQAVAVATAYPLPESERRALQKRLETWLHSNVRMQVEVDAQLIGGLVIQTRDQECDQSVRGQLRKMRERLLAN